MRVRGEPTRSRENLKREIARLNAEDNDTPWLYVNRVIYDPDVQMRLVIRIVEWAFVEYRKATESGDHKVALQLLHTMLVYFLPPIKDDDYKGGGDSSGLVWHRSEKPR